MWPKESIWVATLSLTNSALLAHVVFKDLPSSTRESALSVSSGLSSLRLPSWSSSPQTQPQPLPCSHCLGWTESWATALLCVRGTPSRPTAVAAVSPNAAAFAKNPRRVRCPFWKSSTRRCTRSSRSMIFPFPRWFPQAYIPLYGSRKTRGGCPKRLAGELRGHEHQAAVHDEGG